MHCLENSTPYNSSQYWTIQTHLKSDRRESCLQGKCSSNLKIANFRLIQIIFKTFIEKVQLLNTTFHYLFVPVIYCSKPYIHILNVYSYKETRKPQRNRLSQHNLNSLNMRLHCNSMVLSILYFWLLQWMRT